MLSSQKQAHTLSGIVLVPIRALMIPLGYTSMENGRLTEQMEIRRVCLDSTAQSGNGIPIPKMARVQ
jgi:hypothetical protein